MDKDNHYKFEQEKNSIKFIKMHPINENLKKNALYESSSGRFRRTGSPKNNKWTRREYNNKKS